MKNDTDHEPGKCHCCHKDTMIRWKNIYHMGSEGLWICLPCEMKLVNFVRNLSREATKEKLKAAKIKKGLS